MKIIYYESNGQLDSLATELQREALEVASDEVNRTIRLLQDLLDLARADSGYLHFQLEPLVLNDLVDEVVGMAEQCSEQPISIEAGTFPIELRADPNRLRMGGSVILRSKLGEGSIFTVTLPAN